jgi:hypothetical protein
VANYQRSDGVLLTLLTVLLCQFANRHPWKVPFCPRMQPYTYRYAAALELGSVIQRTTCTTGLHEKRWKNHVRFEFCALIFIT